MAVSVLLLLDEAKDNSFPCLLALGDNTSAIGWIFRSSKTAKTSTYYEPTKQIARHVAKAVTESGARLCAQHIKGEHNDVSDLLSFHGKERGYSHPLTCDNPCNSVLTQRVHKHFSQIVPQSFAISQLPPEIESFVCRVLRTLGRSWTRGQIRASGKWKDPGSAGTTSLRAGNPRSLPLFVFQRGAVSHREEFHCLLQRCRFLPLGTFS